MPQRRRTLREHFAARLAEARLRAGFSQRELARKAGWEQVAGGVRINRYELAKSEPDLATLETLAQKLGVPPASLLAGSEDLAAAFTALTKEKDLVAAVQALAQLPKGRRRSLLRTLLEAVEQDEG